MQVPVRGPALHSAAPETTRSEMYVLRGWRTRLALKVGFGALGGRRLHAYLRRGAALPVPECFLAGRAAKLAKHLHWTGTPLWGHRHIKVLCLRTLYITWGEKILPLNFLSPYIISHSLFLIYCCPLFPTSMQSLLYLQMLFIRVQMHFIVQVCSNILQRMDFGKAIWMDVQHFVQGITGTVVRTNKHVYLIWFVRICASFQMELEIFKTAKKKLLLPQLNLQALR